MDESEYTIGAPKPKHNRKVNFSQAIITSPKKSLTTSTAIKPNANQHSHQQHVHSNENNKVKGILKTNKPAYAPAHLQHVSNGPTIMTLAADPSSPSNKENSHAASTINVLDNSDSDLSIQSPEQLKKLNAKPRPRTAVVSVTKPISLANSMPEKDLRSSILLQSQQDAIKKQKPLVQAAKPNTLLASPKPIEPKEQVPTLVIASRQQPQDKLFVMRQRPASATLQNTTPTVTKPIIMAAPASNNNLDNIYGNGVGIKITKPTMAATTTPTTITPAPTTLKQAAALTTIQPDPVKKSNTHQYTTIAATTSVVQNRRPSSAPPPTNSLVASLNASMTTTISSVDAPSTTTSKLNALANIYGTQSKNALNNSTTMIPTTNITSAIQAANANLNNKAKKKKKKVKPKPKGLAESRLLKPTQSFLRKCSTTNGTTMTTSMTSSTIPQQQTATKIK